MKFYVSGLLMAGRAFVKISSVVILRRKSEARWTSLITRSMRNHERQKIYEPTRGRLCQATEKANGGFGRHAGYHVEALKGALLGLKAISLFRGLINPSDLCVGRHGGEIGD